MDIILPLFILFEGIDGSGKSTLADMLCDYFNKYEIPLIKDREPTDSSWGRQIRELLKDENAEREKLLELFLLDREEDVNKNILPALKNNWLIIMDRYYYSNAAYQGAMGINPDSIIDENRKRKFPEPDRVYLIDIDPEIALKRINERNQNNESEIFERKDFLMNVRKIYHSIANDKFMVLDGTKNPEDIIEIITEDISGRFIKNK